MRRGIGACVLVALAATAWGAAPPAKWRELTEEERKEVEALGARLNRHATAGEFEQALKVAERIAAYRRQRQGGAHWEAVDAGEQANYWRLLSDVPVKDRPEVVRASALNFEAISLVQSRARLREAERLLREALTIREKALGEQHPETAASYDNLAYCLDRQGKHKEALPLRRRALRIREKVLGPDHPHTALSCNNVAYSLEHQGKHKEALPLYRRALRTREKVLGPDHPSTADSYGSLASCLNALGGHKEALPLYRRALRIFEKALGADHPHTAGGYNSLAHCLSALGEHKEALPLYRRALRIREKVFGPDHPSTARCYNNVALCLAERGEAAEALPLLRRALRIFEEALGADHPSTAGGYNNLAVFLWRQKKHGEAARLWQRSLRGQEAARALRADSGFDRAQQTRGISPHASLAAGLASLGQPRNAFAHAEASLARGLLDDLAALTRAEAARGRELRARLANLEPILASFSASAELSDEQKARREAAKRRYGRLWQEWSDLLASASARAVLPPGRIQEAIPPDAALVLWVDGGAIGERWGCVVRSKGPPAWVRLARSDAGANARLYRALGRPGPDAGECQKLVAAFGKAQLGPLRPHLEGVKRLFVVPTGVMAHVPAELLDDELPVSYVPSGSFLARVRERHRALDGTSLLALGDPAFDKVPPEPPVSGALLLSVLPDSNAAKAGLQAGDVLLSVGGLALDSPDDLKAALAEVPAAITFWRDGRKLRGRLAAAPLGAAVDPRSARAAVRAWLRDRERVAARGTGHRRLPGTRLEVRAVSALVKGSTVLLGSDASEQRLDELIDRGELRKFRLLHLATHGEADHQRPGNSALILAQDRLPDPLAQVNASGHVYDGRLTVERIRRRWELDADLVVLSACETALGRDAWGDGLLGFAHAFLSKGARSVVLSRWKVDDAATALLMVRFYENLLGKRDGLKQAMGRAAALDEAKRWLRALPRKEAERLAALHGVGALRGSEGNEKPPAKAKPVGLMGERPYAHPFYWAAFTLVGDPD